MDNVNRERIVIANNLKETQREKIKPRVCVREIY